MEVKEVFLRQILNPTSIDLGEYVINPFKGCEYSCLYCYAQFNKVAQKDGRPWGSYVDARINAPLLLEKEVLYNKPKNVLLGSITECFQPLEAKYKITKKCLEVLNLYKIKFSILTRSPLVLDYIDLLKQGMCESIYFTINSYDQKLKDLLEPKSPSFQSRIETVKKLKENGINVTPYFSPVLPFVSDIKGAFNLITNIEELDFEGLNFNLGNIENVVAKITTVYPELKEKYDKLLNNNGFYNETWRQIKEDIQIESKFCKIRSDIYIHGRKSYFENKYAK
ncbi:radical SAM protein [Elusimicrobiota bacterium]